MLKDYERLVSFAKRPQPPADLADKIMFKIAAEKKRRLIFFRIPIFSLSLIGAIAIFIPVWHEFVLEWSESGFSQFISLVFSDLSYVLAHFNDFTSVILESVPALGIGAVLTVFLTALLSLRELIRDVKTFAGFSYVGKRV